jgi:hypothetical protein
MSLAKCFGDRWDRRQPIPRPGNARLRASGTIQLSAMTQHLDLELYKSRETRIDLSIRTGTSTDTITLTTLAAGDYYVRVIRGATGARSAYALRFGLTVTDFSAPCCGRPRVQVTALSSVGRGSMDQRDTWS